MIVKRRLASSCAMLAATLALQTQAALAQTAATDVSTQPASSPMVSRLATQVSAEPRLDPATKLNLLQHKIKYVFVLYQENRAFDHYFGTFPGANGLFTQSAGQTRGFVQPIVNTDGSTGTISPFLITQSVVDQNGRTVPLYPADTDSVDHSHTGMDNGMDFGSGNLAANDRYALNEEGLTTKNGQIVSLATGLAPSSRPTLVQKQRAELAMSHLDCDTVPFLWHYADRFAMFDNFHQTEIGPSTPNAIAMIAGQSGETQWALHPDQASSNTSDPRIKVSGGEPVVSDPPPYGGSNNDPTGLPLPFTENRATPALNQTYATLPLSFMGPQVFNVIRADQNPAADLADIQHDLNEVAAKDLKSIPWGWYQEGYDLEPTDQSGVISNSSYVTHHNGPQYFGYIADNTRELSHLHGLADFYNDIDYARLPKEGGVFYVRGGYGNNDLLRPLDPNPTVQANFQGNDDHPAYSDAQISEALLADEVNAIAQSPYWNESAIVITYDETDGLYDHVPPRIRSLDPEGQPLAGGPRIPAIVISPYGKSHVVVHQYSEHSSVIKFIDEVFNLEPLADLPDETRGRALGRNLGQTDLGPADDKVADMGDLSIAFDNNRLLGNAPLLPPGYAIIAPSLVTTLPHFQGHGCAWLHMTPTDYVNGQPIDPPPADFNPRPGTTPGTPTSGTWTP